MVFFSCILKKSNLIIIQPFFQILLARINYKTNDGNMLSLFLSCWESFWAYRRLDLGIFGPSEHILGHLEPFSRLWAWICAFSAVWAWIWAILGVLGWILGFWGHLGPLGAHFGPFGGWIWALRNVFQDRPK